MRKRLRLLLIAVLAAGALLTGGLPPAAGWAKDLRPLAVVAEIRGAISPATTQLVTRAIKRAESDQAEVVVLLLDTPGGLDKAMRRMVQAISTSPTPVIVYVSPVGARAASAGLMITLAAHVAAMAPGTNIGAASPVAAGGKDVPETMERKIINDMVAYARSLAESRGRNADWAEKAVRYAVSLPAVEAAAEGVIDVVAPDLNSLLDWADGREVRLDAQTRVLKTKGLEIRTLKPSFRDRILGAISDPNLAYLLFMLGLLAVYFELSHPGAVLPGVVGVISLILAFFAFQTLSVNLAGVLLILVGVALFLMEIKITSYGLLSLAGVGCLFVGSIMLYDTDQGVRLSWSVLLPTLIVVSGFFAAIVFLVFRSQLRRRVSGVGQLVGLKGQVLSWAGDKGKVFVRGEIWQAEAETPLPSGTAVTVVSGQGLKLKVRPLEEGE